jgi:hypothetical protein
MSTSPNQHGRRQTNGLGRSDNDRVAWLAVGVGGLARSDFSRMVTFRFPHALASIAKLKVRLRWIRAQNMPGVSFRRTPTC